MTQDVSIEEILRNRLAHLFDKVDPTHFNDLHGFVISETEKALFSIVLEKTKGNQLAASRMLGVNRNTLQKNSPNTSSPCHPKTHDAFLKSSRARRVLNGGGVKKVKR